MTDLGLYSFIIQRIGNILKLFSTSHLFIALKQAEMPFLIIFFHTVDKTLSLFCIGFKRNSLVFGYERNKLFPFFRCYSHQLQVKVKNKGRERKTWRCIRSDDGQKRSCKDRVRTYQFHQLLVFGIDLFKMLYNSISILVLSCHL